MLLAYLNERRMCQLLVAVLRHLHHLVWKFIDNDNINTSNNNIATAQHRRRRQNGHYRHIRRAAPNRPRTRVPSFCRNESQRTELNCIIRTTIYKVSHTECRFPLWWKLMCRPAAINHGPRQSSGSHTRSKAGAQKKLDLVFMLISLPSYAYELTADRGT